MKKVLVLAGFGLFMLASCAKDYTCVCKFSGVGAGTPDINLNYEGVKKKDAQESCDGATATYAPVGGSCSLK
jgi:hypothetical protein